MATDNRVQSTPTGQWPGLRIVVVGMARSGRAVARLLARQGARVRGTDLRDAASLDLDPEAWRAEGIELSLGGYRSEDLDGADLVVLSPGVPKTAPPYLDAVRRGIPVRSELEVASRFAVAPMAAVTGTNGKSTTVTVLGALLRALGHHAVVAGNVGRPLSDAVESVAEDGILVVEVSSFQLEDIETFHPRTAAVLNLAPDHLDRYPSFDAYVEAKLRLLRSLGAGNTAVIPEGEPRLEAAVRNTEARVLRFGGAAVTEGIARVGGRVMLRTRDGETDLIAESDLALPGPHNADNIAAALALLLGLGLDPADPRVVDELRRLRGLPHRLEPVGELDGVAFVNDSKATNPESLRVALASFPGPVVLLAGGRPKESDYAVLNDLIRKHVGCIVLIGEATPILRAAWGPTGVPIREAGRDLEAAVLQAREEARAGGWSTVLFSPGCASFDMFRDYEDRGDRFRTLIEGWGGRS